MWCAAVVTWGVATVAGMGVAVFVPDLLPDVSRKAVGAPVAAGQTAGGTAVRTRAGEPAGGAAKPTSADTAPGARQRAADQAIRYAQSFGWRSGIAVLDLQTGDVTLAGDADGFFHAMSTVKLLIAADLLAAGTITGGQTGPASAMISASDDAAANDLYAAAGGDALIPRTAARYQIPRLGTPPTRGTAQWGSTQVSPHGMVRFLKGAAEDPAVSSWLVATMLKMTPTATDGTNQIFGLKAADATAAVKQGWGGDGNPADVEGTPSVGYVDRGRYAVAIYTSKLPEEKLAASQAVVSAQAKLLLPGGRIPRR